LSIGVMDERAREDARGPAEEVEWGNELFTVVVDGAGGLTFLSIGVMDERAREDVRGPAEEVVQCR